MLHHRARAAHRSVWNEPLAYAEARDPDLAYGTSAHYSQFSLRNIGTIFPIHPTGRQHNHVLKPCGGSLEALLFRCKQGRQ